MNEGKIIKRQCYIKDKSCFIPLAKDGVEAICDEEHFETVAKYNWHQTTTGLPKCHLGFGKFISLLALLFPHIKFPKYIDGNRLNFKSNNIAENTRICKIEGDVCYIPMTNGDIAIVDSCDADKVSKYNWCKNKNGYPCVKIKGKSIELHRILHPEFLICDHINRNKLDNRQENLRNVDKYKSSQNRRKFKNNTSGYKGVSFDKESQKFSADIGINGKFIKIGRYKTAEIAAMAYDAKAKELHGQYAVLNFPEE